MHSKEHKIKLQGQVLTMAKNLEERLKNIDEKISQLKAQKQLIQNKLKEQERKMRTKKLIEIGAIFYSAGIKDQETASKVKELLLHDEKFKSLIQQLTTEDNS